MRHAKTVVIGLAAVTLIGLGVNVLNVEVAKPSTPPNSPERTYIWSSRSEAITWAERHDLCIYTVEDGFATTRCGAIRLPAHEVESRRLSNRDNFGQYADCLEWLPREAVLQTCEKEPGDE